MSDNNIADGPHTFRNWPVKGAESLAFRFQVEDSRTGIYVLSFSNGERYVGQSLNVINRFADHRRRWNDITHIAFRPSLMDELNTNEREVLRAVEHRGYTVRNIDLAGRTGSGGVLENLMEEQAQKEWLASPSPEPTDSPRYLAATRRTTSLARFQELMDRADSIELIDAVSCYVNVAIPWPAQTEGRFWTTTAMAATGRRKDWRRLISVSAQNAEMLVIGESITESGPALQGFLNIDKEAEDVDAWLIQSGRDAVAEQATYGTVGGVCCIQFTGVKTLMNLLQATTPVTKPAKSLALNLMRKGPSMYTRFHNDHLADAIFDLLRSRG